MPRRRTEPVLLLGLSLALGCIPELDELDELDGEPPDDSVLLSGRTIESQVGDGTYLGNGLSNSGVSGLDIRHGLDTQQGLSTITGMLTRPEGRLLSSYLVECALPEDDWIIKEVGSEIIRLDGAVGLAPEWKSAACDEDCQEWVSACLLARTNASGQHVTIWITGDHPNLGLGLSVEFPMIEASFYGNVFQGSGAMFYCHGSERSATIALANERTCTSELEDCGFTAFGICPEPQRCVMVDGIFPTDCAEGQDAEGHRYHSITTFLPDPDA